MSDKKEKQGIDNLLNELKSLTQNDTDKIEVVQKGRRSKSSDSDIKNLLIKTFGKINKHEDETSSEYDVDSSDFIIVDEKLPADIEELPIIEPKTEIEVQPKTPETPKVEEKSEIEISPKIDEFPQTEPTPEIETSPEKKPETETPTPDTVPTPDESNGEQEEPQIEIEIPNNEPNPEIETSTEEKSETPAPIPDESNGEQEEPQIEIEIPNNEPNPEIETSTEEKSETPAPIPDESNGEQEESQIEIESSNNEEKICGFEEPSDDTDINMAIALGYSDELRDTVGDLRIREACTKIAWDNTSIGADVNLKSDNLAFGYRNREFTDMCQEELIRKNFFEDKKKLIKRIMGTGIFMFIIMLYENSAIFGINLPGELNPLKNPVIHMLFALQLLVFCAVFSYKQIYSGILNAFLFTPTFLSIPAVSVVVSAVYNIISVFTYKSGVPIMFNFSAAFCLFISCICEYMNYKREYESFSFITENHNVENSYAPLFRHDTECKNLESHKFTYDVSRVGFISKYFYRTNKKSKNSIHFNYFWISLIVVGMLLAVLTIAVTQDAAYAMCALAMPFAFGLPVTMLISSSYPLYFAVCKLLRKKGTIIGEQSVYQHSEQSTYSFEDLNAFPANNIPSQKIRLYNNNKMYEVLYNIKLLFFAIDSPLVGIVDGSILDFQNIKKEDVELKKTIDIGVEAIIKSQTHILAGNYEFISQYIKDFTPSEKDKVVIEEGRISVMYIALDGELAAKIYVTYDINKGFLRTVRALEGMGHRTAILTTDPNINDKLMHKICPDIKHAITVNRPKESRKMERADCGIVVNGKATDISYPLSLCSKIKTVRELILKIQIGITSVSVLVLALLSIFAKLSWLSSLLAVFIQVLLATTAFIIIRIKLKH